MKIKLVKRRRCEQSDLWTDECAHCRPAPPRVSHAPGYPVDVVIAKYGGHCRGCGEDIEVGDEIAQPDDGGPWVHLECA